MDEAIKQIGERLKGLREVLNIPAEEIAELCEISLDHYLKIESGEAETGTHLLPFMIFLTRKVPEQIFWVSTMD